jgi:SAM-dependent methyltransferase
MASLSEKMAAYGKAVARNVLPPILMRGLRTLRGKMFATANGSARSSAEGEYSTLEASIEVPCQVECYLFCRDMLLRPGDAALDVGFGLGYGLQILAAKAERLAGVDIDEKAVSRGKRVFAGHPRVQEIQAYDGKRIPFADQSFDVVSCVEVIEHVPDYDAFLDELARVARRAVFLTTPIRRPDYTLPDGRPKNYFHLREWSHAELDAILRKHGFRVQWHFLSGKSEVHVGKWTDAPVAETWTLVAVIELPS